MQRGHGARSGFMLVPIAAVTIGGRPLGDDARIARLATPKGGAPDVIVASAEDRNETPDIGPP